MPSIESPVRSGAVIGVFFAIMAGFCWGTFGIARALGPEGVTSISASGARLTIAAFGLIIWAFYAGGFQQAKLVAPVSRWPWPSMVLSGVGLGGFTYLYLESMFRAGVSIGAPVSCASIPICSILLELIIYKKRPSSTQVIGLLIAVVGMTMATYAPDEQIEAGQRIYGVIFAVASGLVFAAYSLSIQANTVKYPRVMVQACVFSAGAIMMVIWAATTTDMSWVTTPRGIMSAAWLGLISGVLGYWLYIRSMAYIPVSIATTLSMVEPLTAAILGIALLNETISGLKVGGLAILFIGIILVGKASTARKDACVTCADSPQDSRSSSSRP